MVGELASCVFLSLPAQAQSVQQLGSVEPGRLYFFSSPSASSAGDFEEEGRPTQRTAGGDRTSCAEQLIALIPGNGEIQNQPGSCGAESVSFPTQTVVEFPTLWFYVPTQSTPTLSAEFVLLDDQEQPVLIQPISLSEIPGVVSVSPNRPLETGKQYRWIFSLLVNPDRPSSNPAVEGFIRRIEPDATLIRQIERAVSPRERIAIYAQEGIWHDALTALADLRQATPRDPRLLTDWTDLLSSVGLGAIAHVPVVDCCTARD